MITTTILIVIAAITLIGAVLFRQVKTAKLSAQIALYQSIPDMAAMDEDSLVLKNGEAEQPYQLILLYGPFSETLQALNRATPQQVDSPY